MTVAELKAALDKMPDDMDIAVYHYSFDVNQTYRRILVCGSCGNECRTPKSLAEPG